MYIILTKYFVLPHCPEALKIIILELIYSWVSKSTAGLILLIKWMTLEEVQKMSDRKKIGMESRAKTAQAEAKQTT